ncbi:hypothetical protein KSS87_000258, partial [Heliosperma pusillum]
FLDILNDAPLAAHRKPTKIYGSIFYCFLLASRLCHSWDSSSMDFSSSSTMDLTIALQLQCYTFNNHRNLSAVSGLPSAEDPTAGIFPNYTFLEWLLHVQPEIETYCSPTLCHYFLRARLVVMGVGLGLGSRKLWEGGRQEKVEVKCGYDGCAGDDSGVFRWPGFRLGTAGMLLLVVWEPKISFLSASALLRIVMLVEVVIAATFMSAYIGYVHQYNSLDSQPDVLKSLYSPLQSSSSLEGIRYYDGRLADQQMALLQYQRENIHFLCEEILRLQECLSKYEASNVGNTPQVDLAHLLAARDQELRTLSAEMDQLQSELQLARSVIAEKDAETQRIRITNNQRGYEICFIQQENPKTLSKNPLSSSPRLVASWSALHDGGESRGRSCVGWRRLMVWAVAGGRELEMPIEDPKDATLRIQDFQSYSRTSARSLEQEGTEVGYCHPHEKPNKGHYKHFLNKIRKEEDRMS